jgi:hypothetical protein
MALGEEMLYKCIYLVKNSKKNAKKSLEFNMTLDMLCIAYKKVVVVKLKFKFL